MTGADLPGETDRTADVVAGPMVGAVPSPGPRPAPPRSDSAVARAITQLDGLAERPLAEHPDVYQQVHEALQGALADIDDA